MTKPYFHPASETYFSISRRGAAFFHRRWQQGESDAEELQVHYVLGSGNHARTFLHQNAKGALIELPLGWYAEKGGYFAMNPGFDSPRPETRRQIDYECMSCHNAYPRIPARHSAPGAEPIYEGAQLPEGIDCQRCHGPGARHVATAQSAAPRAAVKAAIVNPARLAADRQAAVCLQCHLETTSTRLPSMIRRFDRPPFSYLPGEALGDHLLAFDHAPGSGRDDKFEIVSAAYRMRQSKCFLKSPAMTCTTCHSIHGSDAAKAGSTACAACHTPNHAAGSECAQCHMPKRRTADAVHVVMTDHLVQRQPAPSLLAELAERHPTREQEYRGEVVPYYPSPLPPSPESALYAAAAQVLHGTNLEAGIPRLEAELARQRPRQAEFYVTLGNAWQQALRPDKAIAAFEEAARLNPGSARASRYLGIARQAAGQQALAAAALQKAISLDPRDAVSWYQLGLLDSAAGRPHQAAAKAEKAIALDPDFLDARNSLGVNRAALGDSAGAERAFRDALRVNPYFAAAHGNLARLLAGRRDLPAALQHFQKAVRSQPDFALDRFGLAQTLTQLNRLAEALPHAEEAVKLAPRMIEARMLLGGLLAKANQLEAAQTQFQEAVRIRPDFGPAHLELARIYNAGEDRAKAIAELQLAAQGSDPASASFAKSALEKMKGQP